MSDEGKMQFKFDEMPISASFREFLESVPPGEARRIDNLRQLQVINGIEVASLPCPPLRLHCAECRGPRNFRREENWNPSAPPGVGNKDHFITYVCSNCQQSVKTFALRVSFPLRDGRSGACRKFGEFPPYGPPTPTRLLRLFGKDSHIFLKGRRCENQGLGIGAFSYYRRIVEGHKDQIFDEIIKVAKKIAPEMVQGLEVAKNENQFLKAIGSVKDGLPQVLFINGHSPMTLLHSALSEGLHAGTDEECLEAAQDVRLVLSELTERIGAALKDEVELNAAISRLTRKK
jgi:hypothetical protein